MDKNDERYCHIFIKGCTDEDYTGFFQTVGYIEQKTTPVCDSEQHCIYTEIQKKNSVFHFKYGRFQSSQRTDQAPTLYDVVPKEEIAEFEELMRKTIADIVSEASSVACWVYVQKYVKQKTLDEMLQELPGAGQFIIVMDTWFERLMADQ